MIDESVELIGAFDPEEIAYLHHAFDHSTIELIQRSKLDGRTALLRWTPGSAGSDDGVTDARRMPRIAFYVLDRPDGLRLTAIQSWDVLEASFPGHFNRDALRRSSRRDVDVCRGCSAARRWSAWPSRWPSR